MDYVQTLIERKVTLALLIKNNLVPRGQAPRMSYIVIKAEDLPTLIEGASHLTRVKIDLFRKTCGVPEWTGDRGKFKVVQALNEIGIKFWILDTTARWDQDAEEGKSKKNPTWKTVETTFCKVMGLRHTGQDTGFDGYTPDAIDDEIPVGYYGHMYEIKGVGGQTSNQRHYTD